MSKDLNPKCKKCRREGQKLFLKSEKCFSPKCAMVKRNFPPGIHGIKGYGRLTDYGVQLREKQKAKRLYQIFEKQFKNYFAKANKSKENTENVLYQLLEMRLDNAVYRTGLAKSRSIARQLVTHGHILVNNNSVDIPSYQLKTGDLITIREKSKKLKIFSNLKAQIKNSEKCSWLSVDLKNMEGKVVDLAKLEETKEEFDPKLIIEFYSK